MSAAERLTPPLIRTVLSALALTLRFRVVEGADQVAGLKAGGPAVLGFWHQQLPACALKWHSRTRLRVQRGGAIVAPGVFSRGAT
jgi:lysophospholipid acyltransferase (LPLAT)-like uncharacterized protein